MRYIECPDKKQRIEFIGPCCKQQNTPYLGTTLVEAYGKNHWMETIVRKFPKNTKNKEEEEMKKKIENRHSGKTPQKTKRKRN